MVENFELRDNTNGFKEAVCIDTDRIYDSCGDKDYLRDLKVYFTNCVQPVIDAAFSIKAKKAAVLNVFIDVEPVPFNHGFYAVDMTFFFDIFFDVQTSPIGCPTGAHGLAVHKKKVILYGSEGNVKVFSNYREENYCSCNSESQQCLPKAVVQVAEPIVLDVKLQNNSEHSEEGQQIIVPLIVSRRFEGEFNPVIPNKTVEVSLGMFTITELERKVHIMVPAYDFCVPDKDFSGNTENPEDLFEKIKFPVDDFFPPRMNDLNEEN